MSGEEIIKLREKLGWSQTELGKHIGRSLRTVIYMEKDSRTPSGDALIKLLKLRNLVYGGIPEHLSEEEIVERVMLKIKPEMTELWDAIGKLQNIQLSLTKKLEFKQKSGNSKTG